MTLTGENIDAVVRVLTPENRRLLGLIHRHKPQSMQALSELSGMAQPNVSRALANLKKVGLIRLVGKKPKRPELAKDSVVIKLSGTRSNR